jgi:hypothetical protein
MRYLTYALVWLSLTQEVEGFIFDGNFKTWLTAVGSFLFKGLPVVHVIPWDALVVGALLASPLTKKNRVLEVTNAIRVTFIGLGLLWVWGVVRGGSAYQTMFQIRAFVMQLFLALLIMATCKTRAHVRALGAVVVFAAVYRAFVLFWFYLEVARNLDFKLNTLTDHADSVLFVSGLFIVLINALERKSVTSILGAALMATVMITAMVLNNRRIAWLDCGVATASTYLLWPAGKTRTVMTRILIALSPALVAYVAIGWGSPTGIFKPVGSISTMFGQHQDPSSIMRDIENYNLLRTLKGNPLLGSGWGHEYVEEVVAYSIADIFPQYRYMPHNSLLGMVAFTGMIGFALIWQYLGVSIFMLARVCSLSTNKVLRVAAHSSLIAIITVVVQYWGDVGLNHLGVNTMLAVTVGLSARLPALAGVWPAADAARARVLEPRHDVKDRENPRDAEPGKPLADLA